MTGTRASFITASINPLPPRGTMTSTTSGEATSRGTSARSVVWTSCTAASGSPAASSPARMQRAIAWLLCRASLPPRRMAALPDLRHKAAASAVTLGRAS